MLGAVTKSNNKSKKSQGPKKPVDLKKAGAQVGEKVGEGLEKATKTLEKSRDQASTLLKDATKGAGKVVEDVTNNEFVKATSEAALDVAQDATKIAINVGTDRAKKSSKVMLSMVAEQALMPLKTILHNPIIGFVANPIVRYLGSKFETYCEEKNINLGGIKPSKALHQLLYSPNVDDVTDEVIEAFATFIENSLPEETRKQLENGNPFSLVKLGAKVGSEKLRQLTGEKDITKGNIVTNLFRFIGKKTPLLNKLSPRIQPWVAGGITTVGAAALLKATYHFLKWTILIATGGAAFTMFSSAKKAVAAKSNAKSIMRQGAKSASKGLGAATKSKGLMKTAMSALNKGTEVLSKMNKMQGGAGGGGGLPAMPGIGGGAGGPGIGDAVNLLGSLMGGKK